MDRGDTSAFGIKALQGHSARLRLRIGDYRAVCTVEDAKRILRVLTVAGRRDVHRGT
ncbi:type II toxin-antitoxin system RelE/ParE family toxin [Streptomyces sp. NPDC058657]|uniref:type II toxin-antitoxin system RelE family toxin n=1 Tax=unclassified Streptomyces TaxID=2593676 RepID=UPI0036612238